MDGGDGITGLGNKVGRVIVGKLPAPVTTVRLPKATTLLLACELFGDRKRAASR
jgi:hypothetical protein